MAAFVAATVAAPAAGWAQAPDQARPVAGFQDGFFVQSADGERRLTIGALAHLDGRFTVDDTRTPPNSLALRRLRAVVTGRIGRHVEFRFMPDAGNGRTLVQDAFVDVLFTPGFRVRAGKDKTPVGYEMLIRAARLALLERSPASGLVPARDVGLQVLGDLAGGTLSYAAGVFNGVPDGTNATAVLDVDGHKDVVGRVVVRPFQRKAASSPASAGLGLHMGVSTGRQSGALPTLRTSLHQPYFTYAAGATAGGRRNRVSPALSYYHASFGAFAEYMRSSQAVVRRAVGTDVTSHGWDVTASHILTGEVATTGILRPRRPFNPQRGAWGAVQIAARYAAVSVDRAAFDRDLASADASRGIHAIGLGANWYPTAYVRYGVSFDRTTFVAAGTARRPAQTAVVVRCQMAF